MNRILTWISIGEYMIIYEYVYIERVSILDMDRNSMNLYRRRVE